MRVRHSAIRSSGDALGGRLSVLVESASPAINVGIGIGLAQRSIVGVAIGPRLLTQEEDVGSPRFPIPSLNSIPYTVAVLGVA